MIGFDANAIAEMRRQAAGEPAPAPVVPAAERALPYKERNLVLYHYGDPDQANVLTLERLNPYGGNEGVVAISGQRLIYAEGEGTRRPGYNARQDKEGRSPVYGPYSTAALYYLDFPGAKVTNIPVTAADWRDADNQWKTGARSAKTDEFIARAMEQADPPDVLAFTEVGGGVLGYALLPHAQGKPKVARAIYAGATAEGPPHDLLPPGVELTGADYRPSPEFCGVMLGEAARDVKARRADLAQAETDLTQLEGEVKHAAQSEGRKSYEYKRLRDEMNNAKRVLDRRRDFLSTAEAEQDYWEVRCKEDGDPTGMLRLLKTRWRGEQDTRRFQARSQLYKESAGGSGPGNAAAQEWRAAQDQIETERMAHLDNEIRRLEGVVAALPPRPLDSWENPVVWKPGGAYYEKVAVRADTGQVIGVVEDFTAPVWAKKGSKVYLTKPGTNTILAEGTWPQVEAAVQGMADRGVGREAAALPEPPAPRVPNPIAVGVSELRDIDPDAVDRQMAQLGVTFNPPSVDHSGKGEWWDVVDNQTGGVIAQLRRQERRHRGDVWYEWSLFEKGHGHSNPIDAGGYQLLPVLDTLVKRLGAARETRGGDLAAVQEWEGRKQFRALTPAMRKRLDEAYYQIEDQQLGSRPMYTLRGWADDYLRAADREGNYLGSAVWDWAKKYYRDYYQDYSAGPAAAELKAAIRADMQASGAWEGVKEPEPLTGPAGVLPTDRKWTEPAGGAVAVPTEEEDLTAKVAVELARLKPGEWLPASVISDIAEDLGVSEGEVRAAEDAATGKVAAAAAAVDPWAYAGPVKPGSVYNYEDYAAAVAESPRPVVVLELTPAEVPAPSLFDLGGVEPSSKRPIINEARYREKHGMLPKGKPVGRNQVQVAVGRARTGARRFSPGGKRR